MIAACSRLAHDASCHGRLNLAMVAGTRVVTMSGEPAEVARAESLIGDVLDRATAEKQLRNQVGVDLPLVFGVPETAVGHIIGWEGKAIQEIEQRSQARIDIGRKDGSSIGGMRDVSLQGLPSQVLRAQCLIAAVVAEHIGAEALPFPVIAGANNPGQARHTSGALGCVPVAIAASI